LPVGRAVRHPGSEVNDTDRKRDAEPWIGALRTIDPESWLSPQVYTPFGRAVDSGIIFFRIPQVLGDPFRKVDCQKFQPFLTKCTFLHQIQFR
jgi:hypothetical protein